MSGIIKNEVLESISNGTYWLVIDRRNDFSNLENKIQESIMEFIKALHLYGPIHIGNHLPSFCTKYRSSTNPSISKDFYHADFKCRITYLLEFEVIGNGQNGSSRVINLHPITTHENVHFAKKVSGVETKKSLLNSKEAQEELVRYNQNVMLINSEQEKQIPLMTDFIFFNAGQKHSVPVHCKKSLDYS